MNPVLGERITCRLEAFWRGLEVAAVFSYLEANTLSAGGGYLHLASGANRPAAREHGVRDLLPCHTMGPQDEFPLLGYDELQALVAVQELLKLRRTCLRGADAEPLGRSQLTPEPFRKLILE